MALTIVQSNTQAASAGGTTKTLAYTGATTTGNTLVVSAVYGVRTGGTAPSSITASDGTNTFTPWVAAGLSVAATNYVAIGSQFLYVENCVGHAATVTVTVTFTGLAGTNDCMLTVWELSPGVHDQGSTGSGTSTAASSSSLTPAAAGGIVLASAFEDDGFGSGGSSAGANFTIDGNSGTANCETASEHWVQGSATASTGAITLPRSSPWVASQAIFIPSGGSTPTYTGFIPSRMPLGA